MLKQLRLRNSIFKAKAFEKRATEKAADFKKRQAELTEELSKEDATEDDIKTVEEAIDNLETEITDFQAEIKTEITAALGDEAPAEVGETVDEMLSSLSETIAKLGKDLADTEEKPAPVPAPDGGKRNAKKGGNQIMNKRTIFGALDFETRSRIMNDDGVKKLLENVRSAIKTRGVSNTELTIPDIMIDVVRDNLHKYSKLIDVVNLKNVAGKARQTVIGAVPEAIWLEATDAVPERAISFGRIEVDGYKVGGFIPIANSYLEDSDLSLAEEITESLVQGIGLAIDKAVIYGTGIKMPVGIITRLAQTAKPSTWSANEPAWTDLHTSNILKIDGSSYKDAQFFAALFKSLGVAKANYAANTEKFWCMSEKTHTDIIAKAVTLNAAGAIVSGVDGTMPVIGGKIIELPFMTDGDIIGGYGSLYLLVQRAGINIVPSEHAKFLEDMTVYRGTARYDGRPTFGEGFVAVNINNVAVTTAATFAAAENTQTEVSGG